MEINHNINFEKDEYKKFLAYIETLKRQKIEFNFNGAVGENTNFNVQWKTEEDK